MIKTNFKTKFWAILLTFMTVLSITTVPLTALAEGDTPQPAKGPLLSSLSVTSGDSNMLEGFSPDKFSYSINAPNSLRNVTIAAAPGTEGDTVEGIGEFGLITGENIFKVTASRAAEGSEPLKQDYIITINRAEATPPPDITGASEPNDVSAQAVDGSYEYSLTGGKATITRYTGPGGDITIPSTLGGYPVTAIGQCAFATKLEIMESITGVTIPEGVTDIGMQAFYCNENMETLSLPDSLVSIGEQAFFGESIAALDIPVNVTSIGDEAFANCFDLTAISVDPDNTAFSSAGGVLYNKDKTAILQYPLAKAGLSYSIPSSVTVIGPHAFRNSYLKSVVIPNGTTEIGDGAFIGCQWLDNVIIPGSVTKIGEEAFYVCSSLRKINIPAGTQSIGPGAFSGCASLPSIDVDVSNGYYASVDGVLFDKDIKTLLTYPAGKSGVSYSIPDTVTVIEKSAFRESVLKAIAIPDGVTSLRSDAFEFCRELLSIEIPDSVTEMGRTFNGCSRLTEAVFLGNRPTMTDPFWLADGEFSEADDLTIYYVTGKTGFPEGNWNGHPIYAFDPAAEHTITYATNGGSGSAPADSNTYAYGEPVTTPSADGLTKQYYRFMGWNTKADGSGLTYAAGGTYKMNPHDVTLYAKWTNTFTVTFDSQDGTSVTSKTAKYNALITAPITPTRTGYSFKGWYKEPECLSAWNFSINRVTNNITLYARWTPKTYTVTFNSRGGSAVHYASVVYNTLVTKPASPTRYGYDFGEWYKESACINAWAFDTDHMPAKNITLYAKWNIHEHSVTFDAKGGEFIENSESLGSSLVREKIAYHSLLYAPLIPVRAHYTFKGWYKNVTYTTPWYFSMSRTPDRDLTLYAKWAAERFTVKFNSQGGSSVSSKTADWNTTITKPSNPARTGYTFGGWYKEATYEDDWVFRGTEGADTVTQNTTLYARWIPKTYTVTFNSKGGSLVDGLTGVPYNTTIAIPETPTKTGYVFGGWYKSTYCTTAWNFAASKVTGNITLYAKWMTSDYKVTFNTMGGTPKPPSQSVGWNKLAAEPAAPVKSGCIFGGWYTSGTSFTDANKWDFGSRAVTKNTTLYARWITNLGTPKFTAIAEGDGTITFTFKPMPYVEHYCVSVFTGPDMSHYLHQLDGTSSTFTMTADPGTLYYFKGWVYTITDKTVHGNTTGFVPETPGKTTGVTATATSYNSIHVEWSSSGIYRNTGYEVWRSTSLKGTYTKVGTTAPAVQSFDNTVKTGTAYYYKVRAYRKVGSNTACGAFSDIAFKKATLGTPEWPSAPVEVLSATSVKISWNATAGASGYELWRAAADTGVFKLLKSITAKTGLASYSCTNTGLVTNQPYYYKVRAYRLVGETKVYSGFATAVIARPGATA